MKNGVPMIQIMELVVFLNKLGVLAGHFTSARQVPLSRFWLESRQQAGTKNAASRYWDEAQSFSEFGNKLEDEGRRIRLQSGVQEQGRKIKRENTTWLRWNELH